MTFSQFLTWLVSSDGGAFILASWALSWGLENFDWWNNLTSKARSLIILGSAIVLGMIAQWLVSRPDITSVIEPYAQTAMYIVAAWLATQTAHRLNSLRK